MAGGVNGCVGKAFIRERKETRVTSFTCEESREEARDRNWGKFKGVGRRDRSSKILQLRSF